MHAASTGIATVDAGVSQKAASIHSPHACYLTRLPAYAEGEARLRAQQELYEAVRAERSAASRSLAEVQVGRRCAGGRLPVEGRAVGECTCSAAPWLDDRCPQCLGLACCRRLRACSRRALFLPRHPPQDEAAELRRRLALAGHQAEQLKREAAAREAGLQREKYDHAKVGHGLVGQLFSVEACKRTGRL